MIGPVPHGIARYVKNLATGLEQLGGLRYDPVFLVSREGRAQIPARFETIEIGAKFLSARELIEIPLALRRIRPALYHSPSFSSLAYCPIPWLVTIHDLNHLHFGGLKEKIYYRTLLRNFAQGAKRVLTVSEFSQREISQWLGRPAAQVEIVYNALDPSFARGKAKAPPEAARAFHVKENAYFVFITHYSKLHKNGALLLRAYQEAKRKVPELGPLLVNASREEIPEPLRGTPGLIPVGKISDEQLRALIEHSRAVLFPSLYEGFGLPPLEAAMLGAHILVSDIPPHREALIDFSPPQIQWLGPKDREAWTQALMKLKGSAPLSTEHFATVEHLERAAARFSVRALAEHMDQIYRSVLELGEI